MDLSEQAATEFNATYQLYSRFLGDVLSGAIPPEQRLGEISIANRWGVGRAPVRELLYRLEQDGLVYRKPKSGTYLRRIHLDEMIEIYDIRIANEELMAPHIAARITDQELDELAYTAQQVDQMQAPSVQRMLTDHAFHSRLHEISGLRHVPRLLRLMRYHVLCSKVNQSLWHPGGKAAPAVPQPDHRQIVAVLRTRDPQATTNIFRDHLLAAKNHLLS